MILTVYRYRRTRHARAAPVSVPNNLVQQIFGFYTVSDQPHTRGVLSVVGAVKEQLNHIPHGLCLNSFAVNRATENADCQQINDSFVFFRFVRRKSIEGNVFYSAHRRCMLFKLNKKALWHPLLKALRLRPFPSLLCKILLAALAALKLLHEPRSLGNIIRKLVHYPVQFTLADNTLIQRTQSRYNGFRRYSPDTIHVFRKNRRVAALIEKTRSECS